MVAATAALLGVTLVAGPGSSNPAGSSSAAPARAAATVEVIAGEQVPLTGTVPQAARRPVLLEQESGGQWWSVTASNTSTSGGYTLTARAGSAPITVRVSAPPALVGTATHPAWTSDTTQLVPVPQTGTLSGPATVPQGTRATLEAAFTPAREGRPVLLQAYRSGAWVEVNSAQQSAAGAAQFSVRPSETTRYRAVAASWKGAAAKATATHTLTVTAGEPPADGPWVTGYYAGWFWDQWYPPEKVDMTAMTHFVFGRVAPGGGSIGGTPGTVVEAAGTAHEPGLAPDGQSVEEYLVDRAHAAGTKALLMLGGDGADGRGFMLSTKDGVRDDFVDAVVDYLVEHGYDGVDVDWENCLSGERGCGETGAEQPAPATEAQRRLKALINELRVEMASRPEFADEAGLITFPGYAVNTNWLEDGKVEQWQADIANMVDQYNLMSYGVGTTWSGGGWHSWFTGALKGQSPHTPIDLESSIAAYEATGVPRDRLGIGIGFYGIYYGPSITGPRQETDNEPIYEVNDVALAYSELHRKGYLSHGTQHWDEEAASTYRSYGGGGYVPANDPGSNPAGMLSYEDQRSIAAKGDWVRETGVGGTIVWTLNYGYLAATDRNPLLDAVKEAFLG